MYSKYKISNRKCNSKLPIFIFQINSISSIESEEFRETSIELLCHQSVTASAHAHAHACEHKKLGLECLHHIMVSPLLKLHSLNTNVDSTIHRTPSPPKMLGQKAKGE